jgi:hypothetical protein
VEFNLNGLPDNVGHISGFRGEDGRIIELNAVSLVDTVLLVTTNVVPSSPILVTLMMEVLSSSETSVLTRATRRNITEDAILHSHCRENLKSYIALTGWTL